MSYFKFTSAPTTNRSSSASEYDKTFGRALNDYKKLTGQDLNNHPFALNPDNFKSSDAVLKVLQEKVKALDDVRDENEMLMTWLEYYVSLLFTVSATLWESSEIPFALEKSICTAIVLLLETASQVDKSYNSLVEFFDRLQFNLQRFDTCIEISDTAKIKQLFLKVMAETLSTLAGFTETMKEKPITKILLSLVGKKDVITSNNIPRLQVMDSLTHEESILSVSRSPGVSRGATPVGEPIRNAGDNLGVIHEGDLHIGDSEILAQTVPGDGTRGLDPLEVDPKGGNMVIRNQYKDKLRKWLTPPDPQTNHKAARSSQHTGTGSWFIQGKTFRTWKRTEGTSLLICGKPGSGKTILCSSIIEDIKHAEGLKSDMILFYYFDSKDAAKGDLRGLLASLLMQLGDSSGPFLDVVFQLYIKHGHGSEQPCDGVLARLIKSLLERSQSPIYIIIDGVDNCPNSPNTNAGTKSARKKVLEFLESIVRSRHSNLYICITSSPEGDMQRSLKILAPSSRRVILHEQNGQMEDIKSYISYFIQNDADMRTWPAGDQDLVSKTLSERAGGIFRWVSHQLNNLRGPIPSQTRNIQEEVGTPLDETFKKALYEIPEEKSRYARYLFQCLVAAIRPLGLKELVDIFSTEFGQNIARNEEAVRHACPALVAIDEKEPKIVRFSQPPELIKDFLTSSRLRTSNHKTISRYHFSLDAANATLSRASIKVLLRFDGTADKKLLESSPLALYAAQHWVDHTQFGKVATENLAIMKSLLDRNESHLDAWIWMHDIDKGQCRTIDDLAPKPSPRTTTPLYYAASCGFDDLVHYLANMHREDIEDEHGYHGTPLHAASYNGHIDVVLALLNLGAKVDTTVGNKTPLHSAFHGGQLQTMRLLLEKDANVDVEGASGNNTVLHCASLDGRLEFVELLLEHNAEVNAKNKNGWTPLHRAALRGRVEVAKRLLEKEAEVNTASLNDNTPLHIASIAGKLQVVDLLLAHKADANVKGEHGWTPLDAARENRHDKIVERLLLASMSSTGLRRPVLGKLRQLYTL